MQAGDVVPALSYEEVMTSPGNARWLHDNFAGNHTFIVFFSNVSDSTAAFAAGWNEIADSFASQPVHFVLISRDHRERLLVWLRDNPFKGWLLRDSEWSTARAWGLEMPETVVVGRDGRALGFGPQLLLSAYDIERILAGKISRLWRSKPHSAGGDKPDVPPSHTVHISPTKRDPEDGTSGSGGPDHWTKLGFTLRPVIAEVFGVEESRIDLPKDLNDGQRYDFALLLPNEEPTEKVYKLVQQAIESHFRLKFTHADRLTDIYVLTAPNGRGRSMKEAERCGGGSMSWSSTWRSTDGAPPAIADRQKASPISDMAASGMTMADFCRALERSLDRVVIDDTGLQASYNFQLQSDADTQPEFFDALHEQLGILATSDRRTVRFLVARRS